MFPTGGLVSPWDRIRKKSPKKNPSFGLTKLRAEFLNGGEQTPAVSIPQSATKKHVAPFSGPSYDTNPKCMNYYIREIPQNYHRFAAGLIPPSTGPM